MTSLPLQEEKSRTSPHIAARRRRLCIAISVVAAAARHPLYAPRPPLPTACRTPHAELHVAIAVPHVGPFAVPLTSSSLARMRWAVGAASTPRRQLPRNLMAPPPFPTQLQRVMSFVYEVHELSVHGRMCYASAYVCHWRWKG